MKYEFLKKDGLNLIEPVPSSPTFCGGISVIGRTGDMVHLAVWADQPCIHPGVEAMERVVLHRLVMTYEDYMQSRIDNLVVVEKHGERSHAAH